jgi:hypothetical protein
MRDREMKHAPCANKPDVSSEAEFERFLRPQTRAHSGVTGAAGGSTLLRGSIAAAVPLLPLRVFLS